MSRGRLWAPFWEAFGHPWLTFLVFEGTGRGWNFDGFLLISRGSPNSDFAEVRGEFTPDEVPTVNLQLQTADSNQQLEN